MDKVRLYRILEYILNDADADELAAIREALKRREKQRGFGGVDIKNVASETAGMIEGQIGGGIDSIRNMIRNFAVEMIRKEAPDIPEEHLHQLIESWIPSPGSKNAGGENGEIPRDVLMTMIRQFIEYSTGRMKEHEQRELEAEIGDWKTLYWRRFPPQIRRIITKFLKNEIDADMFNELIERSV